MSDKPKILIVDDRRENLLALRQVLREADVELIEALSGNDALMETIAHDFALAILDVQMPEMNGYELAEFLRGDSKTANLPIIFMTAAYGEEAQMFRGYDAGAVDYIVKPYNPDILLAKVRVFLDLYRAQRDLAQKILDLAASEERYQTLVTTLPDIVYRIDAEGRFTFLNDAVMYLGFTPEELTGRPFSQIIHPGDILRVSRESVLPQYAGKCTGNGEAPKLFDERRVGPRKTMGLEVRIVPRKGGEAVYAEIHSSGEQVRIAEVNSSGLYACAEGRAAAFLGSVGVIRDITRRKKNEMELARYRQHLEDMVGERTTQLEKRAREMECLYGILRLVTEPRASIDDALQAATGLITPGLRHPELACARIVFEDRTYTTPNFKESPWKLSTEVRIPDPKHPIERSLKSAGTGQLSQLRVEVFYLEERREWGDGPFLDEERQLIGNIAGQLGVVVERRQAEEALLRLAGEWQTTFNAANDAIFLLDKEQRVVCANEMSQSLFHCSAGELLGKHCWEVIHGATGPILQCPVHKARRSLCRAGRELQVGETWLMITCDPILDESGQYAGVVHIARDITEAKKSETALRENRRFLADLIENSGTLVFVKDCEGRYQLVNHKWEEVTGLSRNDVLGKKDEMLFPAASARQFRLHDCEVMESGTVLQREEMLETAGEPRFFISIKFPMRGNDGNVTGLCGMTTEITDRKRAEVERERLMAAIEQVGEMVVITDLAGTIRYVNPAFTSATGFSREEVIGQNPSILNSGRQDEAFYHKLWETISNGSTWKGRMVNKRKDGELFVEDASISPVRDTSGRIVNYVTVKRDITEHLRLSEQLEQAQKMESVGRLAGGVAHDFNNMLGIILGYAEIALSEAASGTIIHNALMEIRKAAHRSADLTRQLLAFARRQTIDPRVLDLNWTVDSILKMLRRLIGEDIGLDWLPGTDLWQVKMDPTQIDQILANLCVNARDAIAGVGNVTIETRNVTLDESYCTGHVGFSPGEYVMLAVSDSGCGMDDTIRKQIFEPFFTTKEVGKGTGLGLSTVYGIVRQNNGFIHVYSEPGRGTTFRIYIPRSRDDLETAKEGRTEELPVGRGEKVLLVEDEPGMLSMAVEILERLGYMVVSATSPGEAISLIEKYPGKIDLLMTDVVMPNMSGRDLAEQLLSQRPDMKCLFTSGYTANVIVHHGVLEKGVHFIQKPFSMRDLARKVREVLDG